MASCPAALSNHVYRLAETNHGGAMQTRSLVCAAVVTFAVLGGVRVGAHSRKDRLRAFVTDAST